MADQLPRLTDLQRNVLRAVDYRNQHHPSLPAIEYYIWLAGKENGFWGAKPLYGHLKKLTERGYLNRLRGRSQYDYTLTDKGKEAVDA